MTCRSASSNMVLDRTRGISYSIKSQADPGVLCAATGAKRIFPEVPANIAGEKERHSWLQQLGQLNRKNPKWANARTILEISPSRLRWSISSGDLRIWLFASAW